MGDTKNVILLTDMYKVNHFKQYPPGTTKIKSYFESRGGKFDQVIFFGLQYILKKWLCAPITKDMIEEAENFFGENFNKQGWNYILEHHGGKLPLLIKAVPEGTKIPTKNVLFTVENTDPQVPWLTNYLESLFIQVWYPMTVCTNSYHQKQLIKNAMEASCDNLAFLPFMLSDFGFRGSSSVESAGIGGCAHLVNFKSTDNLASIKLAQKYYNAQVSPRLAASV